MPKLIAGSALHRSHWLCVMSVSRPVEVHLWDSDGGLRQMADGGRVPRQERAMSIATVRLQEADSTQGIIARFTYSELDNARRRKKNN